MRYPSNSFPDETSDESPEGRRAARGPRGRRARGDASTEGAATKEAHLREMMEQLFPGRWDQLRPITAQELKATRILSLPLTEASAKISAGPPLDPPEDVAWPVWAGVLPIRLIVGTPEPAPDLALGIPLPDHARSYKIG